MNGHFWPCNLNDCVRSEVRPLSRLHGFWHTASNGSQMNAQQILIYSDSLTGGIIPNTRQRLPFESRWPGIMECALLRNGEVVRVIEDCLNGRRTAFDDPFKPGRNGLVGFEQRIEVNSPLKLVILMLGTNDFQSMHSHNAWHSGQGIASLVDAVRRAPIEPRMPLPEILIVAPPLVQEAKGPIAPKLEGAREKCVGLATVYEQVARDHGCEFLDAGKITTTSKVDGVHLDANQHRVLGIAIADVVALLFKKGTDTR